MIYTDINGPTIRNTCIGFKNCYTLVVVEVTFLRLSLKSNVRFYCVGHLYLCTSLKEFSRADKSRSCKILTYRSCEPVQVLKLQSPGQVL